MTAISETDKAYAAGFFDGEGCVDIRYRTTHGGKYERFELRIHIPQIAVGVLEWMKEKFGGSVDAHGGPKCSRWLMTGPEAAGFLETVMPYLNVKRQQAETALQFAATFPERRKSNGRAGFERVPAQIREQRLHCFLRLREIRKEGNVSPSGNRDPLSSERAIRGLSPSNAKVGNHCRPQTRGEDGSVH
jgi:hypothetical protein